MIRKVMMATLIACFSISVQAKDVSVVGSWRLISMEQQQGKEWKARCPSPSGIITYTAQGYMAVGINCHLADGKTISTEVKDTIFYTGTYTLGDKSVTHHVLNSNHADFIGQDFTRELRFENHHLLLNGRGMSGNTVRLVWEKIE